METIAHPTPRSLEVLSQHVRAVAPCGWCGAEPGGRCIHGRGLHLARFIRALVLHQISVDEMAAVIMPFGHHFCGATIIRPAR